METLWDSGLEWKVGLILAGFALLFLVRMLSRGRGGPDLGPVRRRRRLPPR
jgi:hypothetical protein